MAPSDLPDLADALPSVEAAHRRLSAVLAEPDPTRRRAGALTAVALLLEAAGGPEVGNGVRTWLEVHGEALTLTTLTPTTLTPTTPPQGQPGEQATALARTVFAGTHRDQRTALARAGLGPGVAGTADAADGPRAARAAYAEQVLASRHGAVLAALDHLRTAWADSTAGSLSTGPRTSGPATLNRGR